ncbi:MAG: hypothetical protein WCX17_03280 [Parcubacteria group bacterium]|jgi:hypothetical protein
MEDENKLEEGTDTNKTKQWLQDNLRIIISVIIVVLIAGGIYSYSKRTEAPINEQASQEAVTEQAATSDNTATPQDKGVKKVAPAASSQETEKSFVETAGSGDSMTVLARRALANYLEKNPDSALTPEHKIYIEDYLRKNVPSKKIFVGTSAEFSKDLIQNAITKSKTLNDAQLKNLHKYTLRVPSLS